MRGPHVLRIRLDDSHQRPGEEAHGTTAVATSPTVHLELQRHLASVRGPVFQSAPVVAVAGVRNLQASWAWGTVGAVRLQYAARFAPVDLVKSKLRGFRQQLADGQSFRHHCVSLHQEASPATKVRKNRFKRSVTGEFFVNSPRFGMLSYHRVIGSPQSRPRPIDFGHHLIR